MWYNPSTWATVDKIQNSISGISGPRPGSIPNQWGGNTSSNNYSPPPQVLGASNTQPGDVGVVGPSVSNTVANSGGTTQNSSQSTYVDPYAKWGGQAAFNALKQGFDTQKQGIYNSATDSANASGEQYGRSILDFLDKQRLGQQGIDTQAAKNELAKLQGVNGILASVGRGIRSGGVLLANKNAGNSSAAQGIANAYGQQGRDQLSQVGNQYQLGNQDVQTAQDAFNVQQASGVRGLQGSKNDVINSIINDAQAKFYALDAQIANASLPDRIAIDQEKQNLRNQLTAQLQQYDTQLNQGIQSIHATTADERRAKAQQLAQEGRDLGAGAFQYSAEAPAQFRGTGPFSSELPLFSLNKRKIA